ncbi:MAG: gamma-glutamyltransferase [Bryobacteraceae bacterium]|nr:gamma-glutamyltransferase [Bryobacteraceae bacterium]
MRYVLVVIATCFLLPGQEVSQSGLLLKAARPMVSQPERARKAMIASAHELASQAGLLILQRGGNAVDAAVAVGFALAVVHPEAGNIGGGGYMVVRMSDGRTRAFDYKEMAPALATPDAYRNPEDIRVGYKASAVPGTVAGMAMAHAKFGRLPWRAVLEPAWKLARDGFPASQRMELILALQVPVMKTFPDTARVFLHGGETPLKQGEIVKQPDLARTIRRIQTKGWREFYEGETARMIDADMRAHNGTIRIEDLKKYAAKELDPLQGTYRGYKILTIPPSSSGGFTLISMLNILEQFPMPLGEEGSFRSRHLLVEAMRRAFRDRAEFSADPAFFEVPVSRLISKEHSKQLAADIKTDKATPSASLAGAAQASNGVESDDTTHFSVVDESGNIVSNTYTLNGFYGSQVIPKGTGVLMNDIMGGFSTSLKSRNVMAPGKRPVSSMTPTVVLYPDGRTFLALGSPGSQTIPNTVVQTLVNMIDYKMSLRDAVEFPRIHHQFQPDKIDLEPAGIILDVAEKLKAAGYRIDTRPRSQGDVHAVGIAEDGWRVGWSDGRRGGRAAGY